MLKERTLGRSDLDGFAASNNPKKRDKLLEAALEQFTTSDEDLKV